MCLLIIIACVRDLLIMYVIHLNTHTWRHEWKAGEGKGLGAELEREGMLEHESVCRNKKKQAAVAG